MPESRRRRRRGRPVISNRGAGAPGASTRPRPRRNSLLYIVASAVIAVLVIAGFGIGGFIGIGSLGGGGNQGTADAYVDGVGVEHDVMLTKDHVAETQTVEYNSVPGTSGDHWARWSECGFFEEELADERVVHNLEHGQIVVSYNLTAPEDIDRLRSAFDDIGLTNIHGVARAYKKIPEGSVALAAWGVSDEMVGVDEDRIKRFFETYVGKLGPEGNIPCLNSGVMP